MTTTSPIVSFGRDAMAIRDDIASLTCADKQTFVDLSDLETGIFAEGYATYEPDYWLLDGSYRFMPATDPHVGLMSASMSDASGVFASPPTLTIIFNSVHSSDKQTFRFSTTDYPSTLFYVGFYDASDVLIQEDTYTVTGPEFSITQTVTDFKKIIIAIETTNKPYRYARLARIDFDILTTFTGTEIKSARVVEQINPLSVELPSNEIEFTLFSSEGDFSIVAPAGAYANLQYKEPVDVHEQIGNATIYIGRFYLDEWESISANEAKFTASDAIGLLEQPTYLSAIYGMWVIGGAGVLSEDLIADVMEDATGVAYELDASLEGISVYGWIPVVNCREALQQICFRIGAYASCSRSNVIQIRPMELASDLVAYDHTLTATDKALASPLKLRPLVTGVEVTSHDYVSNLGGAIQVRFEKTLAVGQYTIIFDGPRQAGSWTGTAVTDPLVSGVNWQLLDVTTGGTVIFESEGFTDSMLVNGIYNGSLPAGTPANVLSILDATLVHAAIGSTVAQRVYDYFEQRYLQKTKLFASLIALGDSVLVDVQSSRQIAGIAERMTTDLAGGYVSDVEIIGVVVPL
jgi:hypothetical protein